MEIEKSNKVFNKMAVEEYNKYKIKKKFQRQ